MASLAGPWFFWVVGSVPTIHNNKLFQTFPESNLKNTLPRVSPGNETAWILTGPPEYPADQLSRRLRGESVIRLSLGKLLVNLLQVVKRTNAPLIPQH